MRLRNTPAFLGAFIVLSLVSVGCATKKHVREAIAPVQNQVNQTQSQVSTLQKQTDENKAKLDDAIQKVGGMKNYLVEVEGFADRTGDKTYNRELSRKRADAVVHYLAVEHSIPLRSIRQLGAGADFPDANNKTRAARKENRRVDVKIYSLDLSGQGAAQSSLDTKPPAQP